MPIKTTPTAIMPQVNDGDRNQYFREYPRKSIPAEFSDSNTFSGDQFILGLTSDGKPIFSPLSNSFKLVMAPAGAGKTTSGIVPAKLTSITGHNINGKRK